MELMTLVAKIVGDTTEFDSTLQGLGSKVGGIAKGVGAAVLGATTAATAAIGAFGISSVKTGMSFDQSMSQVAATMGKTVDEIGELRDFAQKMGAETAFSATEAADALNYMALAGYDAETAMAMLPNVLNLAAAGGIDLASASDMVTDAQTALGLSIEETNTMVDQMAKAASKSNTSVAQLGEAFLTIGATARNLSGGTTELSTVLGVLADNGIKGAEAGTKLRNIIVSLQTPTKDGQEAFAKLGMTYDDVYDAAGNMKSLPELFTQISAAMEGMTQAEKDAIVGGIFNKGDLASINSLLGTTAERWDDLEGQISDAAGAAQKMAETQLDNLAGDITLLKSAFEGFQIAVSDTLTPLAREFTQFGGMALQELTKSFKEGGIDAAMETLGTLLSQGFTMLFDKLPAMVEGGIKLLSALGKGLIDNLPILLESGMEIVKMLGEYIVQGAPQIGSAIMQLLQTFGQYIGENAPMLMESALNMITTLGEGFVQGIPTFLQNILPMLESFSAGLRENAGLIIDAGIELILNLVQGFINALPELLAYVPEIVINIAGIINDNAPKLLVAAGKLILMLITGLIQHIPDIIANMGKIVEAIFAVIQAVNWLDLGGKIIKGLANGIKNLASNPVNAIKEIGKKLKDGIGKVIKDALQWGKDLVKNFINGIKNSIPSLSSVASGIAGTVRKFLHFSEPDEGPLSDFHTYAPDMMKMFAQGIKDNENLIREQLEKALDVGDMFALNGMQPTSLEGALSSMPVSSRQNQQPQQLTVILQLDRMQLGKAVYMLNNEETQRVGVSLAGGVA